MLGVVKLLLNSYDSALILVLTGTFLVWYAQYHWRRRKLYRMAAQVNGPLTLPFIGNALYFIGSNGDILDNLIRISKEFESPVRLWLGQQLFFLIWTPADMATTLNSPHALAKADLYKLSVDMIGSGLLTAPVPKWKRHRKLIAPTFNQKILDDFVGTFSKQSYIMVEKLKIKAGKEETFNIWYPVSLWVLDILCETTMGVPVNAQITDSKCMNWLNTAMKVLFKRLVSIWYHPNFIFSRTTMGKEFYEAIKKMGEFTSAVITEKRKAYQKKLKETKERSETLFEEEPHKRSTLLQKLIEISEEGAQLTDQDLHDEVNTFLDAGGDTLSSTISFTFVMLGMFPDIQEKVHEEVMDVLGSDRPVENADLANFRYLELVIKETMRIFPSGVVMARSIAGDIQLETCTVPAGSSVALLNIALHRDPKIWPNPLHFDPNRFLPEEVSKRHTYSCLPFSGGPRNCIGWKFAMMAMKTLIATVIRKYRFSTDYKNVEAIKLKVDLSLKAADGYRVSVVLRE